MEDISKSEFYDPKTLRLNYSVDYLKKLPIRVVDDDKLYKLMESMTYNPTHLYDNKIAPYSNEVGCDDKFRYIMKKI